MRRTDVFARDAFQCVYCGRGDLGPELTVDHVEPRMRGGDHSAGNLVTACVDCNRAKGGMAAWAFLATRPEERAHFLAHTPYVWRRLRRAIREAAEV